ncbi:MAG: creatininase family protein [Rubrobacteraceae bacterium]
MNEERPVALAQMTSPEAAEALDKAEVALLAVGATEQHGPNMTLETDTVVAYRLALRIAEALYPRAVVAPALPYGVSYHHMRFPGTMTLSPETFQAVVLEIVQSLRQHGIEHFFIVDGHAGNQGALDVLMAKLRFQMGINASYLFYFTLVEDVIQKGVKTERWGHACEVETSIGLALQSDIVRSEALQTGEVRPDLLPYSDPVGGLKVGVPLPFDEMTENGALGDALQASEAFGKDLANTAVQRSVEFLERFLGEP